MLTVELILSEVRAQTATCPTSLRHTQIFMRAIRDLISIDIKKEAPALNDACIEIATLMNSKEIQTKYSDLNILFGIRNDILGNFHAAVKATLSAPLTAQVVTETASTQAEIITIDKSAQEEADAALARRLATGRPPKRNPAATKRVLFTTPSSFSIADSKSSYYPASNKRPKF